MERLDGWKSKLRLKDKIIFLIFQEMVRRVDKYRERRERYEEVERDRMTERKRKTGGDKTECVSEGGERRRGQERVHCDMSCTDD